MEEELPAGDEADHREDDRPLYDEPGAEPLARRLREAIDALASLTERRD